jgi:hypothetical protein
MQPLCGTVATLAVVAIYYIWRKYFFLGVLRERTLRRRITFMLWVIASDNEPECLQGIDKAEEVEFSQDLSAIG